MSEAYVAPELEVLGTVHELTLAPFQPGRPKIIGGDLDGVKVKIGGRTFAEGYS